MATKATPKAKTPTTSQLVKQLLDLLGFYAMELSEIKAAVKPAVLQTGPTTAVPDILPFYRRPADLDLPEQTLAAKYAWPTDAQGYIKATSDPAQIRHMALYGIGWQGNRVYAPGAWLDLAWRDVYEFLGSTEAGYKGGQYVGFDPEVIVLGRLTGVNVLAAKLRGVPVDTWLASLKPAHDGQGASGE